MYEVTVTETITRTLTLATTQDFLDLMESATGRKVELEPDADEADQVYDMIADSSVILQRIIDHPDAEITQQGLEADGYDFEE